MSHFVLVNPSGEYHSPYIGGAVATVNFNLGLALQRAGHDVTVVSVVPPDHGYNGVPISALTDVNQLSRTRRKLAHWEVLRRSFDAEAYGVHLRSVGRALRTLGHIDAVITHNDLRIGWALQNWLPKTAWVPWLHNEVRATSDGAKATISSATLVVCVSRYIKSWTMHRYELASEQMAVALSGVDGTLFCTGQQFDAQSGPLKVLYVGRLLHDKGVDLVVDAVAALQERGLEVGLTVLGSRWWYGDDNQLEDWYAGGVIAQTFELGGSWHSHASRAVTADILRSHDVVGVLSRFHDPAPLVTLEAMASGCAVVVSNRGGIPELAGGAATVVPPGDLSSVIEVLATWCQDRKALRQAKERALERARIMTWDQTAAAFLAAYELRCQQ